MSGAPKLAPDAALASLLDAVDEGILLYDEQGVCAGAGRRVCELFGLDAGELVGASRPDVLHRLAQSCDAPETLVALLQASPTDSTVADPIEIIRPRARTVAWTTVPIPRGAGAAGRIDVVRDVSRERRAERATEEIAKRLEEMTRVDALTGLANRRHFEQEIDREHRRAQRAWNAYAVARVDIDGMAAITSEHGHAVGDDVLRKVGEALRAARREYDVVARWIDDEFVVLLPGADGSAAKVVVGRIVQGFSKGAPIEVPGGARVTVSAGAAVWIPPSGEGPEDILRRASAALDAAKRKGPSSVDVDAGYGAWKDPGDDLGPR